MEALAKKSKILKIKSRFFLYRALTYSSFLLLPVWIQKIQPFNQALHALLMVFYNLFMAGQWFLLGKEIDHRLKIYFKVNSSMDRVIYRLILGKSVLIIYFNLISLLPHSFIDDFFWGTWVVLGLFYSWPTRGKIIQESVSTQLNEFKFLDSFEKTVLVLCSLIFVISFPKLPELLNIEALKLYFDPLEKFAPQFWKFLYINYFPFHRYPELFKLAWCVYFYVVGLGIFLLSFYALLRVFLSRRLAILGVFALLSSWSFSKYLINNFGSTVSSTFSILWIWSILWGTKSSTYRAGLFIGLLGFFGSIINQSYAILLPIKLLLFYFLFFEDKTFWFKRQFIKYSILGLVLSFMVVIMNVDSFDNMYPLEVRNYFHDFTDLLNRKAFFYLSIIGMILLLLKLLKNSWKSLRSFRFELVKTNEFLMACSVLVLFSLFFDSMIIKSFSLMSIIIFFSLVPLEWIFQSISRLRSRRNIIFVLYIIICLLDSHLEGRIKIFSSLFTM